MPRKFHRKIYGTIYSNQQLASEWETRNVKCSSNFIRSTSYKYAAEQVAQLFHSIFFFFFCFKHREPRVQHEICCAPAFGKNPSYSCPAQKPFGDSNESVSARNYICKRLYGSLDNTEIHWNMNDEICQCCMAKEFQDFSFLSHNWNRRGGEHYHINAQGFCESINRSPAPNALTAQKRPSSIQGQQSAVCAVILGNVSRRNWFFTTWTGKGYRRNLPIRTGYTESKRDRRTQV